MKKLIKKTSHGLAFGALMLSGAVIGMEKIPNKVGTVKESGQKQTSDIGELMAKGTNGKFTQLELDLLNDYRTELSIDLPEKDQLSYSKNSTRDNIKTLEKDIEGLNLHAIREEEKFKYFIQKTEQKCKTEEIKYNDAKENQKIIVKSIFDRLQEENQNFEKFKKENEDKEKNDMQKDKYERMIEKFEDKIKDLLEKEKDCKDSFEDRENKYLILVKELENNILDKEKEYKEYKTETEQKIEVANKELNDYKIEFENLSKTLEKAQETQKIISAIERILDKNNFYW